MKCLIKNKIYSKFNCPGLQGGGYSIPVQHQMPEQLNLDDCYFHAINTYLPHHELKNSLLKIIQSKGLLSNELQIKKYGISQERYQALSPKCNGDNYISICQKQSFLNEGKQSESFQMYPAKRLSIILSKDKMDSCKVERPININSAWLDGELRVQDKIPVKNFIGFGVPCETYLEMFTQLKTYGFSQEDCLDYINNNYETSFLKIAEEVISQEDLDLPIYSILSGKNMGNKYVALNEVFTQENALTAQDNEQ